MKPEDSGMICPFCKTRMVRGYISMIASGGVVYFSNEKLSWGWGDLGTWRKDKETVLEGFPDNYSRTGYKCDNCNAILIEGRPSSTQAEKVKAAQAEVDKVNLQNRIRRI